MSSDANIKPPTAKSIASYVSKGAARVRKVQQHRHMASESMRETDYKGHHIIIRTTYSIEVDGVPVTGHVGVTNDGRVHYHAVPNAAFPSAIDLVKQLIDIFPDDFGSTEGPPDPHGSRRMQMPDRRRLSRPRRSKKGQRRK